MLSWALLTMGSTCRAHRTPENRVREGRRHYGQAFCPSDMARGDSFLRAADLRGDAGQGGVEAANNEGQAGLRAVQGAEGPDAVNHTIQPGAQPIRVTQSRHLHTTTPSYSVQHDADTSVGIERTAWRVALSDTRRPIEFNLRTRKLKKGFPKCPMVTSCLHSTREVSSTGGDFLPSHQQP